MEEHLAAVNKPPSPWEWVDLANLTSQLEEALDKRRNPGNPHLRESDHAGEGGCPQECLDFRAALAACKKFMEKYSHD